MTSKDQERATTADTIQFTPAGMEHLDALADHLVAGCYKRPENVVNVFDAVLNGDLDMLCRDLDAGDVATASATPRRGHGQQPGPTRALPAAAG